MHFVYPISAAVLDQVMDTGVLHAVVGSVFRGLDSDPPVHSIACRPMKLMIWSPVGLSTSVTFLLSALTVTGNPFDVPDWLLMGTGSKVTRNVPSCGPNPTCMYIDGQVWNTL